jgi:hypothetical protein
MKIMPIFLLISIMGLSESVVAVETAVPLFKNLSDDSDNFIRVVVGAHAISAFIESVQDDTISAALTAQWERCLHYSFDDDVCCENIPSDFSLFLDLVRAHAWPYELGVRSPIEITQQWIADVWQLAVQKNNERNALGTVRKKSGKVKSFWKPFSAGLLFAGAAALGYVWWKQYVQSETCDARVFQFGPSRSALASTPSLRVDQDALDAAQLRAITRRDAAVIAPMRQLREAGRQWIPRLAPEICTYLQEHKGLVVHQVTQTQMLVNTLEAPLRRHVAAAHQAAMLGRPIESILRIWRDQAFSGVVQSMSGVELDAENMRHVVREAVEQGQHFATLVALQCGSIGGSGLVSAYKRMIRNQNQQIVAADSSIENFSPLLQRHPEYYSAVTCFLVRRCQVEIEACANNFGSGLLTLEETALGLSYREVGAADLQRFTAAGGVACHLDDWVYALHDAPDIQHRAIELMYQEVIRCIQTRFSGTEQEARMRLIGSLWQGKRTRRILRVVYNRSIERGDITGTRLPGGTGLAQFLGQMSPRGGEGLLNVESESDNDDEQRVSM